MAAEGLITFDELRSKLAEAERTRERVQAELEALNRRRENIEELERDRDAVMESYAGMVPEELDNLASEERHQIYKILRLRVTVGPDTHPEVSGAFGGDLDFCDSESSSPRRGAPIPTSSPPCWKRRLVPSKTPCSSELQYGFAAIVVRLLDGLGAPMMEVDRVRLRRLVGKTNHVRVSTASDTHVSRV